MSRPSDILGIHDRPSQHVAGPGNPGCRLHVPQLTSEPVHCSVPWVRNPRVVQQGHWETQRSSREPAIDAGCVIGVPVMPKSPRVLGPLLALAMVSGAAEANTSGNELLAWLSGAHVERAYALRYIDGVVDGIAVGSQTAGKETVCLPAGVNLGQIADLVAQDLRRVPASRHLDAYVLIYTSLVNTWPCETSK